jgi:hypothetical protein
MNKEASFLKRLRDSCPWIIIFESLHKHRYYE